MKAVDLFSALNDIDPMLILEAEPQKKRILSVVKKWWVSAAACACVLALTLVVFPTLLNRAHSDQTPHDTVGGVSQPDTGSDGNLVPDGGATGGSYETMPAPPADGGENTALLTVADAPWIWTIAIGLCVTVVMIVFAPNIIRRLRVLLMPLLQNRSKRRWLILGTVSGCLVLAIVLPYGIRQIQIHTFRLPDYQNATLSMQDVADSFRTKDHYTDLSGREYVTVSMTRKEVNALPKIPTSRTLPVYRLASDAPTHEAFFAYLETRRPAMEALLGQSVTLTEEDDLHGTYEGVIDGEWVPVCHYQKLDGESVIINAFTYDGIYRLSINDSEGLLLDGDLIRIDPDADRAEIEAYVVSLCTGLNELLGTESYDYTIPWDQLDAGVRIRFENRSYGKDGEELFYSYNHGLYPLSMFTPMIVLNFNKNLICNSLSLWENPAWRDPLLGSFECNRISLTEAENMLQNGYVYVNDRSCAICLGSQPEVDFSSYDKVTLEYKIGTNGYVIPFYAFYKRVQDKYAVAHVVAIEVSGLREYYEKQIQQHHPS